MKKTRKTLVIDAKQIRQRLGLNQQEFWSRVGVAQSCGSRYEGGRRMPKPVQELLRVVHVECIDLSRVHARDFAILDYLRVNEPDTYRRLSKQVGSAVAQSAPPVRVTIKLVPKRERPSIDNAAPALTAVKLLTGWAARMTDPSGNEFSTRASSHEVRSPEVMAAQGQDVPAEILAA